MPSAESAELPLVAIYADESCLGNGKEGDNPGGAGALLEYRRKAGGIERRDVWVSEPSTTNNRMALCSVIESFRLLKPSRVIFTSDSRYLIDGLTSWVFGWAERGWTRKGGPIENLSLWSEAIDTVRSGGHLVAWRWVRGHNGHPQNEYANHLATRAAADQSSSDGIVTSGFDAWLATQRRLHPLAEFPDAAVFVASKSLPLPLPRPARR
jgi:ribonuclease HI